MQSKALDDVSDFYSSLINDRLLGIHGVFVFSAVPCCVLGSLQRQELCSLRSHWLGENGVVRVGYHSAVNGDDGAVARCQSCL